MTEDEKYKYLDVALNAIVTEKTALIMKLTKLMLPEAKDGEEAWKALDDEIERAGLESTREGKDEVILNLNQKTLTVLIFNLSLARDVLVAIAAVQRFKNQQEKEAK